jgi:hypothetical protein
VSCPCRRDVRPHRVAELEKRHDERTALRQRRARAGEEGLGGAGAGGVQHVHRTSCSSCFTAQLSLLRELTGMLFRLLADAVIVVHVAFVAFVLLGGLLAMRWPAVAWIHLPCAVYGAAIEIGQWICALTPLENELRRRGGEAGYAGGFVEHYVLAVLYPGPLSSTTTTALASVVVIVNAGVYAAVLASRRRCRLR